MKTKIEKIKNDYLQNFNFISEYKKAQQDNTSEYNWMLSETQDSYENETVALIGDKEATTENIALNLNHMDNCSVVVFDYENTLYERTAGSLLSKGYKLYNYDIMKKNSTSFDFFDMLRGNRLEISRLTDPLVEEEMENNIKSTILTMAISYIDEEYDDSSKNMREVVLFLEKLFPNEGNGNEFIDFFDDYISKKRDDFFEYCLTKILRPHKGEELFCEGSALIFQLSPFKIEKINNQTSFKEMDISDIFDEKIAVFVNINKEYPNIVDRLAILSILGNLDIQLSQYKKIKTRPLDTLLIFNRVDIQYINKEHLSIWNSDKIQIVFSTSSYFDNSDAEQDEIRFAPFKVLFNIRNKEDADVFSHFSGLKPVRRFSKKLKRTFDPEELIYLPENECVVYSEKRAIKDAILTEESAKKGGATMFKQQNTENETQQYMTAEEEKNFEIPKENSRDSVIIAENLGISRTKYPYLLNENVLVLGPSGCGKSHYYIEPNLLQCNSNYIITDPNGELFKKYKDFFKENGYEVKAFDLEGTDDEAKDTYNPIVYIETKEDIDLITEIILQNTSGGSLQDPFFENTTKVLISALLSYIWETKRENGTLVDIIDILEKEDYLEFLDEEADKIEKENPDSYFVKNYHVFRLGSGKTLKTVQIETRIRLSSLKTPGISSKISSDSLDIYGFNQKKRILFILMPVNQEPNRFITSLLISQTASILCAKCSEEERKRRKDDGRYIKFILDEFGNLGKLYIDNYMAISRSNNVGFDVIVQTFPQIKAVYQKSWEVIVGNCDTILAMGAPCDVETAGWLNKAIKRSVDPDFKGEVLTAEDLPRLRKEYCVAFLRGQKPFLGKKYDVTKHPEYYKIKK